MTTSFKRLVPIFLVTLAVAGIPAPIRANEVTLGPADNVGRPAGMSLGDFELIPDGALPILPDTPGGSGYVWFWSHGKTFRLTSPLVPCGDPLSCPDFNAVPVLEGCAASDPCDPSCGGSEDNGGAWLYSVLRDSGNNLTGFYHGEDHCFGGSQNPPGDEVIARAWFSVWRALSTDNGVSWGSREQVLTGPDPKPAEPAFGGDGNAVAIRDTASDFRLFFGPARNGTRMSAAISSTGSPLTWLKYEDMDPYDGIDGAFATPGLGGASSVLPGLEQTPLSSGSIHFNEYLNRYVMVGHTFVDTPGVPSGSLVWTASDDLLHWHEPRLLLSPDSESPTTKNDKVWYPTIIDNTPSNGYSNLHADQTAWLYYGYFPDEGAVARQLRRRSITFSAKPAAAFTSTSLGGHAASTSVQLEDMSDFPDPSLHGVGTWKWDFGDGSDPSAPETELQNPTHVFPGPGTYAVALTATNSVGSNTIVETLVIEEPKVDFIATPSYGQATLQADLSAVLNFDAVGHVFDWDFGDGSARSTAQSPTHAYTNNGHYTVTLSVTGPNSLTCTKANFISVVDSHTTVAEFASAPTSWGLLQQGPNWFFLESDPFAPGGYRQAVLKIGEPSGPPDRWESELFPGLSVRQASQIPFANEAVRAWRPLTRGWVEIDTGVNSQNNVSMSNEKNGGDGVRAAVLLNNEVLWLRDIAANDTLGFPIDDGSPGTRISRPITPNDTIYFIVSQDGEFLGDGTNMNPRIRFRSGGTGAPPLADFTVERAVGAPGYTARFHQAASLTTGSTGYAWDFGDGSTGSGEDPTHQFTSVGFYTVKLTVSDTSGSSTEEKAKLIAVLHRNKFRASTGFDLGPPAGVNQWSYHEWSETAGYVPLIWDAGSSTWKSTDAASNPDLFVGASSQRPDLLDAVRAWQAPHGGICRITEPIQRVGGFDGDGAMVSVRLNDELIWGPHVLPGNESTTLYSPELSVPVAQNDVVYFHTNRISDSKDDEVSWNPKVTFYKGGSESPEADFSVTPGGGFAPLTVSFFDSSQDEPVTWEWDFGDGSPVGTSRFPIHVYANPGTYSVSLTVTNLHGSHTKTRTNFIVVEEPHQQ